MPWDDELSEEQRRHASHEARVLRLVAGPGTGKTRVMTRRIAYLIEERRAVPSQILALTFTRAAAQELRDRLEALLGAEAADRPVVSTLHAFALRELLRNAGAPNLPNPIRIADDYEERWVIHEEIARLTGRTVKQVEAQFDDLASDWETLSADDDEWERLHPSPQFLGAWSHHRQVYGYTLRDELIYSVKKALEQNPLFELERDFSHVLVDEYQDLNKCEIEVIRRLVGDGRSLFAAGDDDQSIYGFRNAFPQGLREFPDTYADAIAEELAECYRCDQDILNLGLRVAEQDPDRLEKRLSALPGADAGQVEAFGFTDGNQEAAGIARIAQALIDGGVVARDILVLLRNDPGNVYSQPIIEALAARGIEARLPTDPFAVLKKPQPRLALCLLRLLRDRAHSLAWRQVLKLRDNAIGDTTLRSIYNLADARGERYALTLAAIAERPEILPGNRRNVVRDEYSAVSGLLDELALSLERSAEDGLREVFRTASVTDEDEPGARLALLSLVSDVEEPTLDDLTAQLNRLGAYKADRPEPGEEALDSVRIMSMHAAKGLTATAVIVAACEDELIPGADNARRAVDDQRRLLYVSLTRARKYLFVTYAAYRPGQQSHRLQVPPARTYTRFLRDFLSPQLVGV